MRYLVALLLIIATSNRAANGVDAAVIADEVCSATDADGTCISHSQGEVDSSDDSGDDYDAEGHQPELYHSRDEADSSDDDDEDELEIECLDQDTNCATYANDGACKENPAYMTHNCAATCDTCDAVLEAAKAAEFVREGTSSKPCMDDDYRCLDWAGSGECDANPGYMRTSCRRSCVACYEGTNQFGIGQRLPSKTEVTDSEHDKTKARIEQSIEYMKTVWTDDKYSRVRHKCRNQHEDCTLWAAEGECEANSQYMQTNCAPACQCCELLEISHRCPIEPGNDSIWKPGDLNTLMENIVDNADGSGDYAKYNPKALSRPKIKRDGTPAPWEGNDGPWVVNLENFITEEEADRLVEIGKEQEYERSADVGKEKPDGSHEHLVSESRTSHNTWCQTESCYTDPLVVPVIERIANVTKTEVKNSEHLQLLQYEPGQFYKQHHDFIPHHIGMPSGVRIMTLFIYLNDVEEGGGTHFPLLDITVTPKKGSAVLWPSVLDEAPESKDGRTDHEALPVLKGLKYGANAWIHDRDFKAAFEKSCV